MKALLIIDMQVGSFEAELSKETAELVTKINSLSNFYRRNEDLVIFIQHDGSKENEYRPGTHEWEILAGLTREPTDIIISKTANSSFYKTNLAGVLDSQKIDEIAITGSATDFCVEATVQAALMLDYNVTIISDGHTTKDRPHATAKTIIDHYNWIWENLTPTGGKIDLITFDEYILSKV